MISAFFRKFLIFSTLPLFIFVSSALAASLQVTKIGNLDLGGKIYSEWWYTGTSPTFYGTANANSDISVKIGNDTSTVKSDGSGNWSYPTSLANGDYDVSFTQGQEVVSFKLHLGQNMPANIGSTGQTSQSTTPTTGYDQLVYISLGVGILLLATYFYIVGDPRRKSVFEAKILEE